VYSFHRDDEHVYYIGSAELMPRNLDTRVELLVPVERPELQAEIQDTLDRCLADDTYSWTMAADDSWTRRRGNSRSVHAELMERTLAWAASAGT
jgi:polyphosphate kinase